MNPSTHTDTATLDRADAEAFRDALLREVDPATESPIIAVDRRPTRRWVRGAFAGAAALGLLVVGFLALGVGSSPQAEAMFVVTPRAGWVDIAPNPAVRGFDPDAAVAELRDAGFDARPGTYVVDRDPTGATTHRAPSADGFPVASHGFEFADGTEVLIAVDGPDGFRMPLRDDGETIDWQAAARSLGVQDPTAAADDRVRIRRDAPVTLRVLVAP